jgi:hypothetical protein
MLYIGGAAIGLGALGALVGALGALVGVLGAGVRGLGALVGVLGAGVGTRGAGVGARGAGVGAMGALVGALGDGVGAFGAGVGADATMEKVTFKGVPAVPALEYGVAITTCVPSPSSVHVSYNGPLLPQNENGADLSVRYLVVVPYPNTTDFTPLPTKVALMLKDGIAIPGI